MMISSFRSWTALLPPGSIGVATSSSSSSGGRRYSIRSFVGGESPASVTSSSARTGRGGSATSVAEAASPSPLVPRANVAEVGSVLGTAAGILDSSPDSPPQIPVWPGDEVVPATAFAPAAPATAAPFLPVPLPLPFVAGAVRPGPTASGSRRIEAAAAPPTHFAVPVTGFTTCRRRRLNASISPTMPIASSTTNAPGLVSSGSRMPASNRPIRPPPRSAPTSVRSRTSNAPRKPT